MLNDSLSQGSLICLYMLIFLVHLSLNMLINVMLIKKNMYDIYDITDRLDVFGYLSPGNPNN